MKKEKKKKIHVLYGIIGVLLIFTFFLFIYDRYFNKIDSFYDIYVADADISLPKNVLLKKYDDYDKLLKKYFNNKEYNNIKNKNIDKHTFEEYDFIAAFYQSKMCFKDNDISSIEQYDNKVVLTVKNTGKCKIETRVSFIPVNKNKYDSVPIVVVQKG